MTRPHDPFATVETLVALTRLLAARDPGNVKAVAFVQWVDALGRTPTDAEFQQWARVNGIRVRSRGRR